ncbi:MAG TPA: hypothetical protein PKE29_18180 [Phycisphaerales bacterium]|nr:hypothetical protein [Phycisphaerales bacterium]
MPGQAPAHPHPPSLDLLLTLTQLPTAAGREWRAIDFLHAWTAARPDLSITPDAAGNLTIAPKQQWGSGGPPILITAHLDHPAFVVERIIAPTILELAFRGGVLDPYFDHARITIHPATRDRATGRRGSEPQPVLLATLTQKTQTGPSGFNHYLAELDPSTPDDLAASIRPGDVATWSLPPAEIDAHGLVHTHACDDLAAAAAALCALDELRARRAADLPTEDVRLLFTRAEEIGFTGALAACKLGTIPKNARVIALENSRSFPDSPIGSGPIVRVGDRMSIFDPRLTAACAKRAEDIAASPSAPIPWQRKLMAGGACEATVFCAYGHQATCLCLPLGNYHNMADLQAVQDKTYDAAKGPPQIAREFIHKDDYLGLIALLTAIGAKLPENAPISERLESLYTKHAAILDER